MDLREGTSEEAENHWYYQHKWKMVQRLLMQNGVLPDVVKDIGAGSGFFTKRFARLWPAARVYAIDKFYEQNQLGYHDGVIFMHANQEAPSGDFYSLMDVLEHVEDDEGLLRKCVEEASLGGTFLITVPAFNLLWSPHDLFLGHFRRYRLGQVEKLAEQTGLSVTDSRYVFAPLFLPALAVRTISRFTGGDPKSDLRHQNSIASAIAKALLGAESWLPANKFFGVSVLVLAKKKEVTSLTRN